MNKKNDADRFVTEMPEMMYPSRMQFEDGSVAEITGITVPWWQVTTFVSSMLQNPLLVDSANMTKEKKQKLIEDAYSIAEMMSKFRVEKASK